jgi:DNA-binding MarR family transcriptional regulator
VSEHEVATDISRLQAEIAVLFRRARVYFKDAAHDVHPELMPAAYAILVRLVEDGPMRATTLVDYFATDKGAISRQVSQLERLGFVSRVADPEDKRAHIIEATTIGRRRCTAARERHRLVVRERLSSWGPGQVAMLGELLAKFNGSASSTAPVPKDD